MKSFFSTTLLFLILFNVKLFGFYWPDRVSFPTTCEEHFNNNKATLNTWMEAEDKEHLAAFEFFLNFIPKTYVADCYACCGCGGIHINHYNDFELPINKWASHELSNTHRNLERHLESCNRESWWGSPEFCKDPDNCESMCWDGGYFRKWNRKYLHFFQHYLSYCSENRNCSCFWPEINLKAVNINDDVYHLLKKFADKKLIKSDFSEYWIAKYIEFDYILKRKIYGEEYHPNKHGMASSLVTYAFFIHNITKFYFQ